MDKKLLFIYNPRSGKGTLATKLTQILTTFGAAGYRCEVYPTGKAGDAKERTMFCPEEYDLFVSAGGDGTLNEVISGLREGGIDKPLGYIPVGSTNDFAASLGLPTDPVKAAKSIVHGTAHVLDVGKFNDRHFIYVAAFGAFTRVSYDTDQTMKNLLGHAAYIMNGVASISEIKAHTMTITVDGEERTGPYIYGMISNSVSVGGIKNITGKDVALADGLFEVTMIKEPKGLLELQQIATALLAGSEECPLLETWKAKEVLIKTKESVPWTLDGEYGGKPREIRIVNEPRVLTMRYE